MNEKTVAIIQARYDSSRLPGKALAKIGGLEALGWVVRAARSVPQVDAVVVATSNLESENPIAVWCAENDVDCFRGEKEDVLARMMAAAEQYNADIVVRLTGDCPFLDPAVCGQLLIKRRLGNFVYATNSHPASWPDGLDCEAFTIDALRDAAREARLPSEREHVTRWIRGNKSRFPQTVLSCPLPKMSDQRWTLDEEGDLLFLQSVAEHLDVARPPAYVEVLDVLERNPAILESRHQSERNSKLAEVLAADFQSPHYRNRSYQRSLEGLRRAEKIIPTGAQTFSKSKLIFPAGKAPLFVSHGLGARIWDIDGNEYVDMVGALLPNVLGYADPDVDGAIREQLSFGISHSLSVELEVELAERIVRHLPCAEMVRFSKNGTDATSGAVRIARAYTGRDRIAVGGYHGWQDWYIGSTTRNKGIPKATAELTHQFDANDLGALRSVLESHAGEFAAVLIEPLAAKTPTGEHLKALKELVNEHGALLVFDEVITGFRVALGGAQSLYGVKPDLVCLGKALGNGMPISALAGRGDVMAQFEDVFLSGTFGGEALSLAAAIATVDKIECEGVTEKLARDGAAMAKMVEETAIRYNLQDVVSVTGHDSWKHIVLKEHPNGDPFEIRTFVMRQMFDNGVLIAASHNMSYAFSEANKVILEMAYDKAFSNLSRALEYGPLSESLDCKPIRPVFSVRK